MSDQRVFYWNSLEGTEAQLLGTQTFLAEDLSSVLYKLSDSQFPVTPAPENLMFSLDSVAPLLMDSHQ